MTKKSNCKILIVDDDIDFLEITQSILNKHEFETDKALSGLEALELVANNNYDVILCDVRMPEMDGFELFERIRHTMDAHVPILMTTGYAITIEDTLSAIKLGAADFLKKPFTELQLINNLTRLIDKTGKSNIKKGNQHCLIGSHYCFEFSVQDFTSFNIADYLVSKLLSIKDLTQAIGNELYLLIEEMISNAFIHGLLNIGPEYRELDPYQYNTFLKSCCDDTQFSNKKVKVNILYKRYSHSISITVTDDGKGFDYKYHLDQLTHTTNGDAITNGVFKGLNLITLLADRVYFFNKGRIIRIEKKLLRNNSETANNGGRVSKETSK